MPAQCLMKAIAMVKPGTRFRDVGDVISKHAKLNGCVSCSAFWMHTTTDGTPHARVQDFCRLSVVKTYCGHGISDMFHCAPSIPHYSPNKAVGIMKEGQTFTIEVRSCFALATSTEP